MKKSHIFLLSSAALLSMSSAWAGPIMIYGRIDTGIAYNNYGGDTHKDNTISMNSGLNTASRIGIRGSEEITSDFSVGFRLENRFDSTTG